MIYLSMVTYNRRAILQRALEGIFATTRRSQFRLLVTNNASTDGTRELLDEYEAAGKLKVWHLSENLGTAGGRNAHWAECLGHDAVRIDDKVLPLYPGWLPCLKIISDYHHAIMAAPYDPAVLGLWRLAPIMASIRWPHAVGAGGPLIFIPGEVTAALGGVDELSPDIKYGWDDCLYIERAKLLGWEFGFNLRTRMEFLAKADPSRRNMAMDYHPLYLARLQEYREAERDLYIPLESTYGYKAGQEAMLCRA